MIQKNEKSQITWKEAKNLSDVGELTAQWLEGKLSFYPCDSGVYEETDQIREELIFFNRNDFVTTFSQPAEEFVDGNAQRACVEGLTSEFLAKKLAILTLSNDLLVFAFPVNICWGYQVPITLDSFAPFTWCGANYGQDELDCFRIACSVQAIEEMQAAWKVVIIDMQWGRNDVLWSKVKELLVDEHDGRFQSAPASTLGLDSDFHF